MHQLRQHRKFGVIDDAMDAEGKGLQGVERLHALAEQKDGRVAPLAHGQVLHPAQGRVLQQISARECFLNDDNLIS